MKKIVYTIIIFAFSIILVNAKSCTIITGEGKNIGDEIACGSEHFYIVSNDGTNVKMLGKYNLLIGTTYYKVTLKENTTSVDDIYLSKEYQEKITEGYSFYNYNRIYNPELGKYIYTSAIFTKKANEQKENYDYIFYNEPKKQEEILRDSRVQEFFSKGYNYELCALSTNEYYGIKFYKASTKIYNIVIFDESVESKNEALNHILVKERLLNNSFDSYIYDSESKIVGLKLYQQEGYEFKTIIFNDEVDPRHFLSTEDITKEIEEENWGIFKTIEGITTYSDYISLGDKKKYIGITLYKQEGYEIRTLKTSYNYACQQNTCPYTTYQLIYTDEKVLSLLKEGFIIHKANMWHGRYFYSRPDMYAIYSIELRKGKDYDYYNVMFREEISKENLENYKSTNAEINEKKQEGYEINEYYSIDYTDLSYTTYVGVQMRKAKNTPSSSTSSNSTSNESYTKVYQDESAIGAHGGQHGAPAPDEVGVVDKGSFYFTYNSEEIYEEGFVDYVYSENSSVYNYLDYYKKTLKDEGYNIKSVDSIAISDIREFAYQTTGEYLPLQEWYENSEDYGNDPIHDTEFLILANLNDYIPEGYSWLWSTTYWTRTANPNGEYYYFVDTLGDLCSIYYCDGIIGAGIRPLVTISSEDIIYNIKTKTDGNGTVQTTHTEAKNGEQIKFTIQPKKGYELKEIKVTDYEGNVIIFTENTFTMPNSNVLIEATFEIKNPNTISLSIIAALMFSILSIIIVKVNYKKMKWLNE